MKAPPLPILAALFLGALTAIATIGVLFSEVSTANENLAGGMLILLTLFALTIASIIGLMRMLRWGALTQIAAAAIAAFEIWRFVPFSFSVFSRAVRDALIETPILLQLVRYTGLLALVVIILCIAPYWGRMSWRREKLPGVAETFT